MNSNVGYLEFVDRVEELGDPKESYHPHNDHDVALGVGQHRLDHTHEDDQKVEDVPPPAEIGEWVPTLGGDIDAA